jgi:hypothetical protein
MNNILLIQRIITGKLFFIFDNSSYYYLQPNNDIKYNSELLYNQIIEDNLYEEWIRLEHIPKILKKLDIWYDEDDNLLKDTIKKLDNVKLALYNNRLNNKKIIEYKKNIKELKNSISNMQQRKNSLNYLTLEDYANIKKNEYIFLNSILNADNNQLVFSTDPTDVTHSVFDNIVSEISKYFISIEEYKLIARSEYWKGIWCSNKYNIFNKAACDLTDEQKSLINISIMYDRIFEHPDCPEEQVIEDDDMLDGWMIYQKNKIEASKKENNSKNFTSKHEKAQEIFIVGDKEDIDSIYSMNSYENKNIIKQRSRFIAQSEDGVDEVNLPDVQRNLLQKVNTVKR